MAFERTADSIKTHDNVSSERSLADSQSARSARIWASMKAESRTTVKADAELPAHLDLSSIYGSKSESRKSGASTTDSDHHDGSGTKGGTKDNDDGEAGESRHREGEEEVSHTRREPNDQTGRQREHGENDKKNDEDAAENSSSRRDPNDETGRLRERGEHSKKQK